MVQKENSTRERPEKEIEANNQTIQVSEKKDGTEPYEGFQSRDPIFAISIQEKPGQHGDHTAHGSSVQHPTSYAETMMHLFKGNIGSGMFAMGDAFKNAGMIFAPIMTVVLGFVCVYCQHLLLNASTEVTRRTKRQVAPDYAETVELCFSSAKNPRIRPWARTAKILVNIFLCVTQLGFCCVYFVFISSNVKQVADFHGFTIDVHFWMAIILLPILLSCLVRNLKFLAPISMVANLLMIIGIGFTFYFSCKDVPSISSRPPIASWTKIPLFFGTAIYAFEGIGLVLPLKNEMKQPKKFNSKFGVLNVGMVMVTFLLTSIGFVSYLKYGEDINGSVTLNWPEDNIVAQVIKIFISISVLLGYALQFYIPVDIMWPGIVKSFGPFKWPVFMELAFRSLLVLVTFMLAESIPALGLLISLIGAVSSTALALFFPPVLQLVLGVEKHSTFVIIKNCLIILIAFIGFATGTYASIDAIVQEFS